VSSERYDSKRMPRFRKSSRTKTHFFKGAHCYEHWYRDNTIYFITARCRDRYAAFESEQAKHVFWNRLLHHTKTHSFTLIIASLLNNHYHLLGYLKKGDDLGLMMRKVHGSVSKLVNDLLPQRREKFWVDAGHQDYFDGCIRNELQLRRAFRYTLTQRKRHGICADPEDYRHTRVFVDLERAVKRAHQLGAFMKVVPYQRYQRNRNRR
jgi:REP element-mobilizing transposase RayT